MFFWKPDFNRLTKAPLWLLFAGLVSSVLLLSIGLLLVVRTFLESLSIWEVTDLLLSVLFFVLCAYMISQGIIVKIRKKSQSFKHKT